MGPMSILQRVELNFWQLVIPLIRESRVIRFFVQILYLLLQIKFLRSFILPVALSAALGIFFGYIGGVFSTIF